MKYRIILETQNSGTKQYYIQKRFCFWFWKYVRYKEHGRYTIPARISYHFLDSAKSAIYTLSMIDKQRTIVKREIIKYE